MEENHAKEVNAMKVEHYNQMDAIIIQVQKPQHQSEDERNEETSIDHKPPYLLQQAPSYYEEVICSIEKWLIEGDSDKIEIDKNRVDTHMVNPPVIEDQVITHDTYETDPSFLTEQMKNEGRHVTHILHTSFESFEIECSTSSVIHPATKKRCKRNRMRK